jgi:hypothetical protein
MEVKDILKHLLTSDYLGTIHKSKCLLELLSNPKLIEEAKEILEKNSTK